MKAITSHRYGAIDQLRLEDVPRPQPLKSELLVRVHVASVNPLDWHELTGTPWVMRLSTGLRRPRDVVRGADLAGVVESVGDEVTAFVPGDRVLAVAPGAFAEHTLVSAERAVTLPSEIDFGDAAALPMAAITALQALDHGELMVGQSVLINGASGGVGTYAIQIAKARGAEVTAVCSGTNADLVRSLGADHVVDYATQDFTATERRYDIILDNVGNRPLRDCRRTLKSSGVYVMVSGPKSNRLLGPLGRLIAAKLYFAFTSQRVRTFAANASAEDLGNVVGMMQSGEIRSVIDRWYPLRHTADAIRYLQQGHARGKVLIDVVGGAA